MINTEKVVGFYTDGFGNEVDVYEQIERYSVCYEGRLFEGDTDGYNTFKTDSWAEAIGFYKTYGDVTEVSIKDNEYGVIFSNGDWS